MKILNKIKKTSLTLISVNTLKTATGSTAEIKVENNIKWIIGICIENNELVKYKVKPKYFILKKYKITYKSYTP